MDVYKPVQAVDFTDTGVWRLIIYISATGMSALLRHTEDAGQPLVQLFATHWEDDGAPLLPKIESAVYDHPRVLEDYATDIVVETTLLTWAPEEALDSEDSEISIFSELYPDSSGELMSETLGDMTILFSLAPGLGAFISRTIPGARIRSHIGVLAERFLRQTSDMPRIYADIRAGEVDLIAIEGKRILGSATHRWNEDTDIAYRIYHLADVLGISPSALHLSLSGDRESVKRLTELMRKHCSYVVSTPVPEGEGMPLAALLLAH